MPYQSIEVRPAAGSLGAEVCDVDLARPLRNATADELRRALVEHLVLFFRDQNLTPDQHLDVQPSLRVAIAGTLRKAHG